MSRSYIPRRESNFSWYFCCGTFNLVLHTKAKRGSAVEYTQVCFCAFMSSISLRASSLGGGGGGLGGRGGNGIRLQSLRSAILMMHPYSTIPSGWLCINDLMNYSAISQVLFVLIWILLCLHSARIKSSVAWVRSVEPEFTVSKGRWNFLNFKPEFLLNRKRPALVTPCTLISRAFPLQIVVKNSHFLSYLGNCYFMFMFRFVFLSFFRSHRSDTLPSRGCLLPIGSLETTASGIRPSRSGAENSFEC